MHFNLYPTICNNQGVLIRIGLKPGPQYGKTTDRYASHCGCIRIEFKCIARVSGLLETWHIFQFLLDNRDIIIALLATTPVSLHACHLLLCTALCIHTLKSHMQPHTNIPTIHTHTTHAQKMLTRTFTINWTGQPTIQIELADLLLEWN